MSQGLFEMSGSDVDADIMTFEVATTPERQQDKEEYPPSLEKVIKVFKPVLKKQDEASVQELKVRLLTIGAVTLSHLKYVVEGDLHGLVKPADFRLSMSKVTEQSEAAGSSSNSARVIYQCNVKSLISSTFFDRLKKDEEILTKQDRAKLIVAVADDIRENACVKKQLVLRESLRIVKAHPTSMGCLMIDDSDVIEAAEVLKNSIMSHIQYIQSETRKRKSSVGSSNSLSKMPRFTKAQNYALSLRKDLPNELPDGETSDTQESKRVLMVQVFESGSSINWTSINKMMKETYCGQRYDINRQMCMDVFLKRWPFIGKHAVLHSHFEALMNLTVPDCVEGASKMFPWLEKFFTSETSKTRKGDSAHNPKKLHKILKSYQQLGDASPSSHLLAIVLCAMAFMKVERETLFLCFEENTSFDEVQSSDRLPDSGKPIIVVLGTDIVSNPKWYVVIEKRFLNHNQVSCAKAINIILMAHFVFKLEYSIEAAPILHFLQRKYFGIEINEGTRTERRKGKKGQYCSAAPMMPPQYLKLMKEFKEYCHLWGVTF